VRGRTIRRLARARLWTRWWFWLLAAALAYLATLAVLRWLLHDYIIVARVHDPGRPAGRTILYLSLVTEFASGSDRVVVALGRALLGPPLAVEGWVRTRLP